MGAETAVVEHEGRLFSAHAGRKIRERMFTINMDELLGAAITLFAAPTNTAPTDRVTVANIAGNLWVGHAGVWRVVTPQKQIYARTDTQAWSMFLKCLISPTKEGLVDMCTGAIYTADGDLLGAGVPVAPILPSIMLGGAAGPIKAGRSRLLAMLANRISPESEIVTGVNDAGETWGLISVAGLLMGAVRL